MRYALLFATALAVCALAMLWHREASPFQPRDASAFQPSHIEDMKPGKTLPFAGVPASPTPTPPAISSDTPPDTIARSILASLSADASANHDLVFFDLLPVLIRKAPAKAAALAESLGQGPDREEMLRRVSQGWTDQDPASAQQWAAHLPDKKERDSAVSDVCLRLGETDAAAALQSADRYWPENPPEALVGNLVQQWAAQDMDAAISWIEKQPESSARNDRLLRAVAVLSKSDPAKAASLVSAEMLASPSQNEAAISVIHQWTQRDPEAALAWVEQFPPGALRERALSEVRATATPSGDP